MKARINTRKEEQSLSEAVFQAYLKLQLAELGYSYPQAERELDADEGFGLLLKTARQLRGLNKAQLSRLTDVTEATISRLERGLHAPHNGTILDLSRALNVPREFLQPERVFSEWQDYAAQVRNRLEELLARGMLKDPKLERVVSEWDDDAAAVRNRLGPAAVRGRLGGLLARDIQATRENRAAIEQEKELTT